MSTKILSSETQAKALLSKKEWNDLINRFFSTNGRTIRFFFERNGKIVGIPRLGTIENQDLGIKINKSQINDPLNLNKILSFGIYDGSNSDEFDGIITKEILASWFGDDTKKIAFSVGKTTENELVILVDLVDFQDKLHGKGDGGEGATPCRIPPPK